MRRADPPAREPKAGWQDCGDYRRQPRPGQGNGPGAGAGRGDGITVNRIGAGPFVAELNQSHLADPEVNALFLANIPLRRWGRAEEVGQLAVYLRSEDAGFITGTDILIDGGWCAR